MTDLAGLRRARATKADEIAAFNISANSTDEDLATLEAMQGELTAMDRRIAAAEAQHRVKVASAKPGDSTLGPLAAEENRITVPGTVTQTPEKGIYFAQTARAILVGRGDMNATHRFAAQTWGERHPVAMEIGAALQANDASSGGFLVPARFSAELQELLMPKTNIRRNVAAAGGVMPLVGGTDVYPTVETGTTAYYIGEGQDATASEPTFGNIKVSEREMVSLVPISNKLLRHSSVQVDRMVRDQMVRDIAQTEDLAFLRGTGNGPAPRGIRFIIPTTNVIATLGGATPTAKQIDDTCRLGELALAQADIPMDTVRWLMPWRVFTFLRDFRDANSNLVFPSLSAAGGPTFKGFPVDVTNNVPVNLGGGSNEAEIYLIAYGYCIIADSMDVRIDASDVAAYKADASTLVSAFSRNQTIIKATVAHDFNMRRAKAAVCFTTCLWGT